MKRKALSILPLLMIVLIAIPLMNSVVPVAAEGPRTLDEFSQPCDPKLVVDNELKYHDQWVLGKLEQINGSLQFWMREGDQKRVDILRARLQIVHLVSSVTDDEKYPPAERAAINRRLMVAYYDATPVNVNKLIDDAFAQGKSDVIRGWPCK